MALSMGRLCWQVVRAPGMPFGYDLAVLQLEDRKDRERGSVREVEPVKDRNDIALLNRVRGVLAHLARRHVRLPFAWIASRPV